ncbi:MAG TPA: Crp/Fnr family transcriptional regulator [Anaerolineales bacterium]|nr:Crp/Fnr family transcriptional regulator [Anaerolineales bacterium]
MKPLDASLKVKLNTLRRNPYFDDLSEEILKEVAGHMQLRSFERGEVLFWEGDPCAGLHIIEEGSVKLYRLSPQGRQYIVRVLQEGDTCNEVPAFDSGTNPVNVETLEKSRVWVINDATLRALVRLHPDFALKVLSNFGKNLRGLVRMVSEMAFYQVTNRLARLISELPEEEAHPPWTQEQLAAQLGTVREVVARSLKELERSGAIRIQDRRIQVADKEALSQWTQSY